MDSYLTIVVFIEVGVLFVGATLWFSRLIQPSAPSRTKSETYECGVPPIGDAWQPFHVRYYLYALLFVVFDVEAAFLFPWAVAFRKVGVYAVVEMIIFVALLAAGFACVWRRGAFKWE